MLVPSLLFTALAGSVLHPDLNQWQRRHPLQEVHSCRYLLLCGHLSKKKEGWVVGAAKEKEEENSERKQNDKGAGSF